MLKQILKICFVIFIAYVLLVINAGIVAFIYVKLNPSYAQTKTAVPYGTISIILVALEFFIYYRYKSSRTAKK